LVPVVELVNGLSIKDIARERTRLVAKAKEGKLSSLARARFTISNMGGFNIGQFTAIINPPESAILAVSSIQRLPAAVEDDTVGLRELMNLTLSVDHRVSDGIVACRFLNTIKTVLEDPQRIFG
jgi:pyruvate dehydrogenase E2 component (dihydrolipoamide acetyltransferase)